MSFRLTLLTVALRSSRYSIHAPSRLPSLCHWLSSLPSKLLPASAWFEPAVAPTTRRPRRTSANDGVGGVGPRSRRHGSVCCGRQLSASAASVAMESVAAGSSSASALTVMVPGVVVDRTKTRLTPHSTGSTVAPR